MLRLALISQAVESLFQKRFKRAGLEVETASELAESVFQLLMEQPSEELETIARGDENVAHDDRHRRIGHIVSLFDSLNQSTDAYHEAVAEGLTEEEIYWRSVGLAGIDALLSMLPDDASELRLKLTASRNAFNR